MSQVVNVFNTVASPVDKSTPASVIDDLQTAIAMAIRTDDAPRLQQPLVHKVIRYAMEFAMWSGLIIDTAADDSVHIRSPDPKKNRSHRVESDVYCRSILSVLFVNAVHCLHGSFPSLRMCAPLDCVHRIA